MLTTLKAYFRHFLKFLRLNTELEDADSIHKAIEESVIFKGTNLWILMFASVVASLGLNINSTAVVIGAMLISPLMGPINGIGYGFATYDFFLLKKSALNFAFAISLSIFASAMYFFVSPVNQAHSELLARTSPTIFDLLIAFFGGLAGMVATCSKKKGNVLPGVAIATALMPPLCTVGYGLATWQWDFVGGALYLFLINSMFIALSAMIVTYTLDMPMRGFVSKMKKKQTRLYVIVALALTFIPSIYYGYKLVQKEKFNATVLQLVQKIASVEGHYLLKHAIDEKLFEVQLVYAGHQMDEKAKKKIYTLAKHFDIDKSQIKIIQGIKLQNYDQEMNRLKKIDFQVNDLASVIDLQNREMDTLANRTFYLQRRTMDSVAQKYSKITQLDLSEKQIVRRDSSFRLMKFELYFERTPSAKGKDSIRTIIQSLYPQDSIQTLFPKP